MGPSHLGKALVILGFVAIASSEWVTPGSGKWSSKEKVICCYDEIVQDSDLSHLLLDVSSVKKVDRFCERILGLRKCISDNEHYLSVAENTAYLQKAYGVNNFYLAICPLGSDLRIKYREGSQCFQLIKDRILDCGSYLPDLSSYKMKKDTRSKCCSLRLHRECMTAAALERCGKDAGDVMAEVTRRYFLQQTEGCSDIGRYDCDDRHHLELENDWKRHHHKGKNSGGVSSVCVATVISSLVFGFVVCLFL